MTKKMGHFTKGHFLRHPLYIYSFLLGSTKLLGVQTNSCKSKKEKMPSGKVEKFLQKSFVEGFSQICCCRTLKVSPITNGPHQ